MRNPAAAAALLLSSRPTLAHVEMQTDDYGAAARARPPPAKKPRTAAAVRVPSPPRPRPPPLAAAANDAWGRGPPPLVLAASVPPPLAPLAAAAARARPGARAAWGEPRGGDADEPSDTELVEAIICDGCDRDFEVAAVGLTQVPVGEWFCPACKAESRAEATRRARRKKEAEAAERARKAAAEIAERARKTPCAMASARSRSRR